MVQSEAVRVSNQVGPGGLCMPRDRMPLISRDEGLKCHRTDHGAVVLADERQGLTLVYLSAQRQRILWDTGCI